MAMGLGFALQCLRTTLLAEQGTGGLDSIVLGFHMPFAGLGHAA